MLDLSQVIWGEQWTTNEFGILSAWHYRCPGLKELGI